MDLWSNLTYIELLEEGHIPKPFTSYKKKSAIYEKLSIGTDYEGNINSEEHRNTGEAQFVKNKKKCCLCDKTVLGKNWEKRVYSVRNKRELKNQNVGETPSQNQTQLLNMPSSYKSVQS